MFCSVRYVVLCICLGVPHVALATVTISEIAWMGTTVSANDEWIELYNTGTEAVSLAGWQLSDGGAFSITLTDAGSLAPGAWGVLERTDDTSAPGTALAIYTGTLTNSGTTLQLRDATGRLVDQVAGGENWVAIGGDNTTKETAQYTTTGWVTAVATPGAMNAVQQSATPTHTLSQPEESPPVVSREKTQTTATAAAAPTLQLQVDLPTYAFVGQMISGEATLTGSYATPATKRQTQWNFGDTYMATGTRVTHHYRYPGTYMVAVQAERHFTTTELTREITVLPVQLSITRNRTGAVQISNDTKYSVPLSGMQVVTPTASFVFPAHTYVQANGTITIPPEKLSVAVSDLVSVFDTHGTALAYQLPTPDIVSDTRVVSTGAVVAASAAALRMVATTSTVALPVLPDTPRDSVLTPSAIEAVPSVPAHARTLIPTQFVLIGVGVLGLVLMVGWYARRVRVTSYALPE